MQIRSVSNLNTTFCYRRLCIIRKEAAFKWFALIRYIQLTSCVWRIFLPTTNNMEMTTMKITLI